MGNPVWFADAAPGNNVSVPKAGGLIPSLGLRVPAGLSVAASDTVLDVDRCKIAPGSTPTLTGLTTDELLNRTGYATLGTPHFDGTTALFGLPLATASDKLSISAFIYPDGQSFGAIFCSPAFNNGGANNFYFVLAPLVGAGAATNLFNRSGGATENGVLLAMATPISGGGASGALFETTGGSGYTPNQSGAFFHVMFSCEWNGLDFILQVVINDTVEINGTFSASNLQIGFSNWQDGTVPFVSSSSPAPTGPNVWSIGGSFGRYYNQFVPQPLPFDSQGMQAAVTELWIAQGKFVDWSVAANRQKFHTQSAGGKYVPVDIGANGTTPFGYKPTIYCTGGATNFPVNRANGRRLALYSGGYVASQSAPTGSAKAKFLAGDSAATLVRGIGAIPAINFDASRYIGMAG